MTSGLKKARRDKHDKRPEEVPNTESIVDKTAEVTDLHKQLEEKDQLIVALTDRLEQAAEQLDRLRRTGADRGGRRGGGSAMPAELMEDHRAVVEDLKQVINRWEEMQAGMTLGRLETQITELRDLVAGSMSQPAAANGTKDAAAKPTAAKPATSSWWEAQKAAMLGDATAPAETSPVAALAPENTTPFDISTTSIPGAPAPLDFENLTLDQARQAISERDQVIANLREPLLILQAAGTLPADLKVLDQLPEAVQQRLKELETQWEAKFRQGEMQLSLERARLSREEAALCQKLDQIQKDHTNDGASGPRRPGAEKEAPETEAVPRRRWFRFMGAPSEDSPDTGD